MRKRMMKKNVGGPGSDDGPGDLCPSGFAAAAGKSPRLPLVIAEQGSFTVGGKTLAHDGTFSPEHFLEPQGQTAYRDHACGIPETGPSPEIPLIFQHGGAQTKRTWETTPDGREGFETIFLQEGVYYLYPGSAPNRGSRTGPCRPITVRTPMRPIPCMPIIPCICSA